MSLVARVLEAGGIPTMCLGSALDIFESGRPPRASFVDYPLGHSAGKPFDAGDQRLILRESLNALATLSTPGQIHRLPNRWDADESWKLEAAASSGDDLRRPRSETPQFQMETDRVAAIATGALSASD